MIRRWRKWLASVYKMTQSDAMIQITRLRWKIARGGYPPDIEKAFLRALEITEAGIKQVRTRTCKKRASAHFDLTDV
jgi:hypothetical protein